MGVALDGPPQDKDRNDADRKDQKQRHHQAEQVILPGKHDDEDDRRQDLKRGLNQVGHGGGNGVLHHGGIIGAAADELADITLGEKAQGLSLQGLEQAVAQVGHHFGADPAQLITVDVGGGGTQQDAQRQANDSQQHELPG